MLWNIDKKKRVTDIPHKQEFDQWTGRLSADQISAIKQEINNRIEGKEVNTAGWIPGNNWIGTPFQAIYETACQMNRETSGQCLGLFVWVTFMEREDDWSFGRYTDGGVTYFKIDRPNW